MGVICVVFHDPAVPEPHHALAVRGNIRFVRDNDNRLPVVVQFVEQGHDLNGGLRIQISCRLVRKQDRRVGDPGLCRQEMQDLPIRLNSPVGNNPDARP